MVRAPTITMIQSIMSKRKNGNVPLNVDRLKFVKILLNICLLYTSSNSKLSKFIKILFSLGISFKRTSAVSYTHLDVYKRQVISWLKNDLELIEDANEIQKIILESNPNDKTVLVPAFTGLGAPYWNMHAKAMFYGMTRTTTWKELVKASVESIAYQITDILNAMENDTGISMKEVKADGGPSKNQYLMQFLAECAQNTVRVSLQEELSATGVAYMAGLTVGIYQKDNLFHQLDVYKRQHIHYSMVQSLISRIKELSIHCEQ